jgi:lipoyl(octanoyl) transferase
MTSDLARAVEAAKAAHPLQVHRLGQRPYAEIWQAMQRFTDARTQDTPDALWLLQHDPVFTLGLAGKPEHVLQRSEIPLVQSDRGGQVTYHGPGQLMAYLMLDLRRHRLGVRDYVSLLENLTISVLRDYGIASHAKPDAPGVYVGAEKIMALGIRVRRGCTYHGIALNVDMDLAPFSQINPCGYEGLKHTTMAAEGGPCDVEIVAQAFSDALCRALQLRPQFMPDSAQVTANAPTQQRTEYPT